MWQNAKGFLRIWKKREKKTTNDDVADCGYRERGRTCKKQRHGHRRRKGLFFAVCGFECDTINLESVSGPFRCHNQKQRDPIELDTASWHSLQGTLSLQDDMETREWLASAGFRWRWKGRVRKTPLHKTDVGIDVNKMLLMGRSGVGGVALVHLFLPQCWLLLQTSELNSIFHTFCEHLFECILMYQVSTREGTNDCKLWGHTSWRTILICCYVLILTIQRYGSYARHKNHSFERYEHKQGTNIQCREFDCSLHWKAA